MEVENKGKIVRYEHQDDSLNFTNFRYERKEDFVSFTDSTRNEPTVFKGLREWRMQSFECSRWMPCKSALLTFLITVTSTCLVLFNLFGGKYSPCTKSDGAFSLADLPEVRNLSLAATTDNSFTATWERPEGNFDYYVIYISRNNDDSEENSHGNAAGSCANGTIIHRDRTQLTCECLETCSSVTVDVRTHSMGPPERTSKGVPLRDVFTPGDGQVPPVDITMVSLSVSETLIHWEPPPKIFGVLTGYTIQTCHTFALCDADENVRGCIEHHTSETSLKIHTTADTPYCILVFATVRCGIDTISSLPAAQLIRTPMDG
ncbi:uncharacterized protein LOC119164375 [Rhipicephalus microplus]|uniref:uncharacterized protein LOC119164375 n=1 Tax=Rhipicephalus microplus TaxID=6941 RepID=UPI003F6C8B40